MDVYSSTILLIATVFIQVCFCQENKQQEPLMMNDFRSYALNMGGTLVDLLRKEISMLSKINPSNLPSTPPNMLGGVLPADNLLAQTGSFLPPANSHVPPALTLPDPAGVRPQIGSALPGYGIPAGISASAGSTVYSFGTNSAPLTVINVYGDLPPNTTLIAHKPSQSTSPLEKNSENPHPSSTFSSTAFNNSEASFQEEPQNNTTSEPQNQTSIVEDSKNVTSSNQQEGSDPDSSASNTSDSTNTQNTDENKNDVTTTVAPAATS